MKVVVQRCYIIYYGSMVELLVSNKFYAMVNSTFTQEW